MKSPEEVLARILESMESAGIPYMVTGSFASNLYGMPRATQDADIVIETDGPGIRRLEQMLGDEFYFPLDTALEAVTYCDMFNVIHTPTGFKVDLIIRKGRPFSIREFERRQLTEWGNRRRWFASAEDAILSKLEWSKKAESERQFRDAVGVARVQRATLDLAYLKDWAANLGISGLLERLLAEIEG